jgi:hypothetical protein
MLRTAVAREQAFAWIGLIFALSFVGALAVGI